MKKELGRRSEVMKDGVGRRVGEWTASKRGVLQLSMKNTSLTSLLVTKSLSNTQKQEWMCWHTSEMESAADWNEIAEPLMDIMFTYSQTSILFSLLSFALKCKTHPLIMSKFIHQFTPRTCMDFLLEWLVFFPKSRNFSCGCLALNLSLKWKLCKWKVLLCDSWNFQHVAFHAGRCPDSSNYCTPANSNDPNSPKRQISSVIWGLSQQDKEDVTNWRRTWAEGDLKYMRRTLYQHIVSLIGAQPRASVDLMCVSR